MLLAMPAVAQAPGGEGAAWSAAELASLKRWIDAAPDDALPRLPTVALDRAIASGEPQRIDAEATALALSLARMHLLGRAAPSEKAGWRIVDPDREVELAPMLDNALAGGTIDTFFALQRPAHEDYSALRMALARTSDPDRRLAIARNMERWRWMPRSLGSEYVLVNIPRFEARLWRGGEPYDRWRVIVGKRSTPTPAFATRIEGVVLNPWWEIPASIVRESVGALVRRNPALARQRGYVWSGGRYRQRPGPGNALGQMKLVMPNPFSIYMHDTPSKALFDEEVRAFSHGCIRTDDAIGYAATLLEGVATREEVDPIVASGKTTTLPLDRPIPLYIAYFTAFGDGEGGVEIAPDIYGRDRAIKVAFGPDTRPAGSADPARPARLAAGSACAGTGAFR
ncbi:L,D-transpeptidase family protein [Erythrobacter sp.]|uniref:L,D-transpeptidase family protein n=1 Tax=Erythrobacter sp. TaxID=1042 RepID=UPI0025BCBE85|nr:L,D-transpeptidase family protein [Erythrobacter sp.]